MPRTARSAPGGLVYHVMNRRNGREKLFAKQADYAAFEKVLTEAVARVPMRVLGWCLMPDHWHLVLWPKKDGELSAFMRWLTLTHTQRWHSQHHSTGRGHVYQGRFKCFPIENDEPLPAVLRYVEGNALRAGLVKRAEEWRWGSLWARRQGDDELRGLLGKWPTEIPRNWVERVNRGQTASELEALRKAVTRSSPYGSPAWVERTAKKLNLQWTLRPRGRPRVRPLPDLRKS